MPWSPSGRQLPQGPILRPVLFNIFISGLGNGTEGTLSKTSDVERTVSILESRAAIQRDPSTWRSGMMWSSTKVTEKSCILDRVTPCNGTDREPAGYKVTLKKKNGVSTLFSTCVRVSGVLWQVFAIKVVRNFRSHQYGCLCLSQLSCATSVEKKKLNHNSAGLLGIINWRGIKPCYKKCLSFSSDHEGV